MAQENPQKYIYQHLELNKIKQVAATCARLGGAQDRPSCEPKSAVSSAGPEAT